MDLDCFDDLDAPKEAPSRVSKFPPRSSKFKPQPKGKVKAEPSSKSEPQESVPVPNLEPQNAPSDKKNEDEQEIKPKITVSMPKTEPSVSVSNNDVVKMETESKAEATMEVLTENDPMDEDQPEEEQEQEEDMIVREIDVFFTPSIDSDTGLYVMQYPLRPYWRPYELDERCDEVRVKKDSKEVQFDLSIDDSTNWDPSQASKFNMKKQTLSSSFMPSRTTGYAVGVLLGNKLHLNPIQAVVQLRPSLDHVNSSDSKRRNIISSNIEPNVKIEDSSEGKPIGSSKKQIKRTEVANDRVSDDVDSWISLKYHSSKSDISSTYLQKMMSQEGSPIEFTMSPYNYMSSLCPVAISNAKSKGPSKRFLLSLPLEERMKKLLLEGPPVQRFIVLMHYAPDDAVEDVLKVLQKLGNLVQGLWAPRTSLLLSDPKEVHRQPARDYILLLFSKSLVISASKITDMPPKLKQSVIEFANTFAVERPSLKDWKFKCEPDTSFMKLYPEIVKKQGEAWEEAEKKLTEFFNRAGRTIMKNVIPKPSVANKPAKELDSNRTAFKIASSNRVLTKMTITAETREALLKVLPKVLQTHKVCSFELIRQGLRDLAISQSTLPKADPRMAKLAADGADAPAEELKEIISEIATNIHGSYVLKSSPDNPQYDDLRKIVMDLLMARGPSAKLKKAEVLEAGRLVLKRDISSTEYNKVMTDFCESKASAWVLKSGDRKPS